MNVFVLCTGRCGSTTFIRACEHIRNFSAAHESRTAFLGERRFNYPPRHIEADNRLTWLLGRLDQHFGNDAYYVHLMRDPEKTAASFARRRWGIMAAYQGDGIIMGLDADTDPLETARDYCRTVTSNIELFLKDKANRFAFRLERSDEDFPQFCEWIGADVDVPLALHEFQQSHNASRKSTSYAPLLNKLVDRIKKGG